MVNPFLQISQGLAGAAQFPQASAVAQRAAVSSARTDSNPFAVTGNLLRPALGVAPTFGGEFSQVGTRLDIGNVS